MHSDDPYEMIGLTRSLEVVWIFSTCSRKKTTTYLIKLCSKQIERGQNSTIGP